MSAPSPPPGWYPDPNGTSGDRYWDGKQWTDVPPPPRSGGRTALLVVLSLVGFFGVLVIGMMIIAAIFGSSSSDVSSESVIGTCQDAVRKGLRDPDSARFSGWEVHEVSGGAPRGLPYADGDKVFEATGMVNAKNGFGGYSGDESISCDAVANSDGTIHAQAGPSDLPKP